MNPEETDSETQRILSQYLFGLDFDPMTIGGACIVTRSAPRCGLPADATVRRLLISEPDQGWSVTIEAVERGGGISRMRVQQYYDDCGRLDLADVQTAYRDWLQSL